MAPLQGLNGWQWIFIMQGVVCYSSGVLQRQSNSS
jgi:hypothetical protein